MPAPCSDPRAVPDPIEGSLELSRTVGEGLPVLLAALLLSGLFVGGWLVLLGGGLLAAAMDLLSTGEALFAGQVFLLSLPMWLAVLALGLLARAATFFHGFGVGHLAVDRAANAEPPAAGPARSRRPPVDWDAGPAGPAASRAPPGGPFSALLWLARRPSRRAEITASMMRLMMALFLPLMVLLAADAALLPAGETLLWRSPPEGGALIDILLLLVGAGALAALAMSNPLLGWVAARLLAISECERAGPARIPPGRTPLERYVRHLLADPRNGPALGEALRTARAGVTLNGASGAAHPFDLYLELPPGGALGGRRALFARVLDRPPGMADIDDIERAVRDVVSATSVPPARVVVIYAPGETGPFVERVEDAVFERLMESHLSGKVGWRGYCCAVELLSEEPDGTYDLVPFKPAGV
ncbi:MAG: hypothetical protein FJ149_10785 [Euryarchaeota archaeon]|nr:hypothetical protein [Euryarchaeota archaeon]